MVIPWNYGCRIFARSPNSIQLHRAREKEERYRCTAKFAGVRTIQQSWIWFEPRTLQREPSILSSLMDHGGKISGIEAYDTHAKVRERTEQCSTTLSWITAQLELLV